MSPVPSYVERTSRVMKETNPYNKLFEERVIFLGTPIDDASANDVMAQIFTLEFLDPDRDIAIYINEVIVGRKRAYDRVPA